MKKTNVFLLMFLACAMSFSQVTTSGIKGSVSDETNSELPGANVIAVHNPTGTTYGAATNIDGKFNLVNLRVGGLTQLLLVM
jgi:hypothetical protein